MTETRGSRLSEISPATRAIVLLDIVEQVKTRGDRRIFTKHFKKALGDLERQVDPEVLREVERELSLVRERHSSLNPTESPRQT